MTGYRDQSGYLPPQKRDRPLTRTEWLACGVAILFAVFLLFASIAGDHASAILGIRPEVFKAVRTMAPLWVMTAVVGSFAGRPDQDPATAARYRRWGRAFAIFTVVVTIAVIAFAFFRSPGA
jgi:hypothetical protein